MSDLEDLRAALRRALHDPTADLWSDDDLDAHLRRALLALSQRVPRRREAVIAAAAGQREYDLAALPDLLRLVAVWHPWNPAAPDAQPTWCPWRLVADGVLRLEGPAPPRGDGSDDLRLHYLAAHTIAGLDGADETTLGPAERQALLLGASAAAAEEAGRRAIGTVTVSQWTPDQYARWAAACERAFQQALAELGRAAESAQDARVPWNDAGARWRWEGL